MLAPFQARTDYADLIRNTPGLVAYWRMRGSTVRNELTAVSATVVGSPLGYQGTPIQDGGGFKFNGTNTGLQSAVNLSGFAQISLSFWMWWDTFTNNDKLAFEFGGTNYLNSGFIVDPNASNGAGTKFNFGIGLAAGSISWVDDFTRPTAGAWHHYLLTMNRATPVLTAFVDGATAPGFAATIHQAGTYGNFANSTLNFMSRNGASLWGAGRQTEVALFGGVLLTANDARNHYQAGLQ